MQSSTTQFRNRIAIAYWLIAAALMAILSAMTYVFLRDGPPQGYSPMPMAVLLSLFWIFGLGAAGYAFGKPSVNIRVDASGIEVSLRTPFSRHRRTYRPEDVREAGIRKSEDSEGDPYFIAGITLADGGSFNLAEGPDREACEAALREFHGRMGRTWSAPDHRKG